MKVSKKILIYTTILLIINLFLILFLKRDFYNGNVGDFVLYASALFFSLANLILLIANLKEKGLKKYLPILCCIYISHFLFIGLINYLLKENYIREMETVTKGVEGILEAQRIYGGMGQMISLFLSWNRFLLLSFLFRKEDF